MLPLHTVDTICGQTPRSWAAENGQEEVMSIVLEWKNVNPDNANKWADTPLSFAARNGHEGVVRMLLERNDVSPTTADIIYGKIPLSWAAMNGHEGVVVMLQGWNNVHPDIADPEYGQKPLLRDTTLVRGRTGPVPQYAPNLQSTELLSPELPYSSEPLPKEPAGFDIRG